MGCRCELHWPQFVAVSPLVASALCFQATLPANDMGRSKTIWTSVQKISNQNIYDTERSKHSERSEAYSLKRVYEKSK